MLSKLYSDFPGGRPQVPLLTLLNHNQKVAALPRAIFLKSLVVSKITDGKEKGSNKNDNHVNILDDSDDVDHEYYDYFDNEIDGDVDLIVVAFDNDNVVW